ncbi:MAG: DUF4340 domain-containing protein, partial [Candidatus Zixiibacteriota bacterium]
MDENKKTIWFAGAALVLMALAWAVSPGRITPEEFIDQGEPFFAEFTDPNEATTLEVIDYDKETGSSLPFKVTFENGKWSIPSHYNYPADGEQHLANTAASVIEMKKDDYRSSSVAEHEKFGVVDPMDENVALKGRGQRLTIKGKGEKLLADLIVGDTVENKEGFRFVRVPGQSRVYAVKTDIEISTQFKDWIESDLLKVTREKINKVVINDYTINERTISINQRDRLTLEKDQADKWKADKMKSGQEVDDAKINQFLTTLAELKIVDVRPKPEGLSQSLKNKADNKTISREDRLSLQSKGFYFSSDGQLLSNEGEMLVYSEDGVVYTLRFGEVVFGGAAGEGAAGTPGESRYLFITTHFDSLSFREPVKPTDYDFESKPDSLKNAEDFKNKELAPKWEKWKRDYDNARKITAELNQRFAGWYYVISSLSFDKLRLRRADLVVNKTDKS